MAWPGLRRAVPLRRVARGCVRHRPARTAL